MKLRLTAGLVLAAFAVPAYVQAQSEDEEEQLLEEVVVVTGMRVTAGGAQDVAFARSEILSGRIPHPDTFTDEGLLSQHDLTLSSADACDQLFCVFGEAIRSDIVNRPNDRYFVGLGFSTNIDADNWQRAPVNLVAVVDKSGSMSGEPLALVRRSLLGLAKRLGASDQLSIVLYGDRSHVYLEPTKLTDANRNFVRDQIRAIASSGSTNMEEGLEVGYRLAAETQSKFGGTTRVVLFTDERPNVGDTSADGFIGMAKSASQIGIGLTTVGVGVQFDSSLAVKLSSTRGGNLFFLPDEDSADRLFDDELDYMVSELAHDLTFTLRPHSDLEIAGVYGLPGDMLSWADDGAVTFTIPTVFLSSRGGGIFVSLGVPVQSANLPAPTLPPVANVLAAAITYVPASADGAPQSDLAEVVPNQGEPSHAMQLASVLVDEYLGLRLATSEHYLKNDQEAAYQALRLLNDRLDSVDDRRLRKSLAGETEMVVQLLEKFAFLSGHSSEITPSKASSLWGAWRVTSSKSPNEYDGLDVGNYILFSPDNRVIVVENQDYANIDWDESQPYLMAKSALLFLEFDLAFKYRLRRDKLTLRYRDREEDIDVRVELKRTGPFPMEHFEPEDLELLDDY